MHSTPSCPIAIIQHGCNFFPFLGSKTDVEKVGEPFLNGIYMPPFLKQSVEEESRMVDDTEDKVVPKKWSFFQY